MKTTVLAATVFLAGILYGAGCHAIREGLHGAAIDAVVLGKYVEGATRKIDPGITQGQPDSMELDSMPNGIDIESLAKQFGYVKGGAK